MYKFLAIVISLIIIAVNLIIVVNNSNAFIFTPPSFQMPQASNVWGAATALHSGGHTAALSTTITVAADAPTGSLIVVGATQDGSSVTPGTVTDSAGNTYTLITSKTLNNNSGNGIGAIYYAYNISSLTNGVGTITYTNGGGVSRSIALSIFDITGEKTVSTPLDLNTTATSGLSSSISIGPSGTPSVIGELFVGFAFFATTAISAASQGAGFTTPPNPVNSSASNPGIVGGTLIEAGTSTHTYAPTLNTSNRWAAVLVSFKLAP